MEYDTKELAQKAIDEVWFQLDEVIQDAIVDSVLQTLFERGYELDDEEEAELIHDVVSHVSLVVA